MAVHGRHPRRHPGAASPAGRVGRLESPAVHAWTRGRRARSGSPSSGCTTTAWPIATSSSSTGVPVARPACPTWRWSGSRRAGRSGRCATTWCGRTAHPIRRAASRSPRRDPRPSSVTPRSRSIRTTRATRTWSVSGCCIPFVDRIVPIIADASVEPGFGTGAVKITPAHDHNDFATGRRHALPVIDVMTDDGHMNAAAGPYAGLTRAEARTRILADLEARGDLVETRDHEMVVGHCERSGDVVEPRIKTQWFINVKPMAELAMTAVREGRTRFVSERFETDVLRLDGGHPRVERQPPAVVGSPDPGVVLPGRSRHGVRRRRRPRPLHARARGPRPSCDRTRTSSTPGSRAGCGPSPPSAGPTPRRPGPLLPGHGDGDRLRHHLLLGGPDDDARRVADGPRAVQHRVPPRHGP